MYNRKPYSAMLHNMVQYDLGCSLVAVVISPDMKLGLAGQTWCNVRAVDHASTIGPLHRQVYTMEAISGVITTKSRPLYQYYQAVLHVL